jgi:hypothetical protein
MDSEDLIELWAIESDIRRMTFGYWLRAAELVDEGRVTKEDVATIWGCAPNTAQGRMKDARELRANQRGEPRPPIRHGSRSPEAIVEDAFQRALGDPF